MATTRRLTFLLLAAILSVSAAQQAAASENGLTTPMVTVNADDAEAEALPGTDTLTRLKQIYRCKARKLEETGTDCKILIVSATPIAEMRG